jgi:acetate kinase
MALILALNAGSSSLKFAVFSGDLDWLAGGMAEGLGAKGEEAAFHLTSAQGGRSSLGLQAAQGQADHHSALATLLDWLRQTHPDQPVQAVSHRVVHGGVDGVEPVAVDDAVMRQLRQFESLAPLHQPHNLAGIEASQRAFPDAVQVACFDTSFHRSHPFVADTFALPRRYYDEGIRRYGFHGLSYEFIARRLQGDYPDLHAGRVIVAHLGNGASMCAMKGGRSLASTMGFTALDGLPMGTRSGQIDPGVLLYLMQEKGMGVQDITDLLYRNAGLRGLSGLSNDVRTLESSGDPQAREALDYFADRCRREIGGLAASIGGLDALVLTGGIGENATRLRESLLHDMGWIGIELDAAANRAGGPVISTPESPVTVLVLHTDEERMLAEHARDVLVRHRPGA